MPAGGLDSRRSWVVAVACFFVQVLTFGLTEASGLLFVATIPRFDTTREKASLPFTVAYCMRSAIGPVIGYIGRKFGIRLVTLFGCILSAISVASCFFATDILELTILWGVIFGFSLGLETSLLNVILNEHFAKHLVKANGLNISGASLGTLLLSPVIEHSVETYGLSGTFLIISGLMLNSIPAAFVMILNKPVSSSPTTANLKSNRSIASNNDSYDSHGKQMKTKLSIHLDSPGIVVQDYCFDRPACAIKIDDSQIKTSTPLILDIVPLNTLKTKLSPTSQKNSLMFPRFWKFKRYSIASVFHSNDFMSRINKNNKEQDKHSHSLPTVFNLSTIFETPTVSNSLLKTSDHSSSLDHGLQKEFTETTDSSNSKWQLQRLFSEPIYIIIIIGSGIYYFIITTFLTIIVDYATDLGISITYSTYIVMWIAVCDMFGYLFQSWIIELRHLTQSQFTSLSFFCLCVASAAMVWCSHFAILLVLISIFEVAQCGVIILAAPLVAEFMDKDLHATGIASVTILSSPMTLAISPLIGFFRDGGGSYAGVFYVLSAASLICSVLFLCIPKLEKKRNNKKTSR